MTDDSPPVLRPRPLRPFELDRSGNNTPSGLATPSRDTLDPTKLSPDRDEKGNLLSRTRSVLNLTSSTLFGIYSPSSNDEAVTPSGFGAQTPSYRHSADDIRTPIITAFEGREPSSESPVHHRFLVPLGLRTILLFITGVIYGIFISELHDTQRIAPVQIETRIKRWSWSYLSAWGGAAILLGALLPWVDVFWEEVLGDNKEAFPPSQQLAPAPKKTLTQEDGRPGSSAGENQEANWNAAIRSITAFIGVAFAIRRLPWQSTLQVSLTLALVNPVLWYLFDRSKPGFTLSAVVGIAGTVIALGIDPEMVPSPATPSPQAGIAHASFDGALAFDGRISVERIGVGTWIASVLFCSSLCFGNVGRKLALDTANKVYHL